MEAKGPTNFRDFLRADDAAEIRKTRRLGKAPEMEARSKGVAR